MLSAEEETACRKSYYWGNGNNGVHVRGLHTTSIVEGYNEVLPTIEDLTLEQWLAKKCCRR